MEARITYLINDVISSKGPKKLCIDVNSTLVLLTYTSFSGMKLKNAMWISIRVTDCIPISIQI